MKLAFKKVIYYICVMVILLLPPHPPHVPPCSSIPLWPGPHNAVLCRLYHPGYLASWLLGFRHWDILAGDQRDEERQRSGYFLPMLSLLWSGCRWFYLSSPLHQYLLHGLLSRVRILTITDYRFPPLVPSKISQLSALSWVLLFT